MEGAGEGARGVELVLAAVGVESIAVKGRPLKLETKTLLALLDKYGRGEAVS